MFYTTYEVMTLDNIIILTIYYSVDCCDDFGVVWWFGLAAGGGCTFSLQLVRESIKEEIDMTANAVTHRTLVCVCMYGEGGGREEEWRAKQQIGPLNVLHGTTSVCVCVYP